MALDDPGLAEGWWDVERHGGALRRWTNGDAVLKLPRLSGPAVLVVRLGDQMRYVDAVEEQQAA